MTLQEYQRAVLRLGFALHHDAGELPGFGLYRQLIRTRFVAMVRNAFRRSWALLGETACEASFARYLADESPRSPILRQVIADFAEFAGRDAVLFADPPVAARDLLRFEAAKWRIASADAQLPQGWFVRELDFDGVLVLNPNMVVLTLQHDVSAGESAPEAHDPHALLVYRRPGDDDVHWYRAPELLRALIEASSGAEQTLGALVQAEFARRAPAADLHGHEALQASTEALLEELASALSVASERGVLCGVREPEAKPSRLE